MNSKWFQWAVLAAFCLLFVSCGLLDPAQQQAMLETINELEATGKITPTMAAAQRELVMSNGVGPWWQQGLGIVIAAVSAYLGVQWRRGPSATPQERVQRVQAKLATQGAGA